MWTYTDKKIETLISSTTTFTSLFNSLIDTRGLRNFFIETREKIKEGAKGLTFEEKDHAYYYKGVRCIPVSNVIEFFEKKTDFDEVSKRYANKWGKTAEFWKRSWEIKQKIATASGNFTHLFAETLGRMIWNEPIDSSISNFCICDEYFVPLYAKQEAIVRFFYDLYQNKEIPVAVENKMIWPEFGISGTFDLLTYSLQEESFMIRDYKTNATLVKDFKKPLLAPFSNYNDEPLSHYLIQQNLYSLMLKRLDIDVKEKSLIWTKDTGFYEKIDLENKEQLVFKAIKSLMEE